jgi:hypothetical protein
MIGPATVTKDVSRRDGNPSDYAGDAETRDVCLPCWDPSPSMDVLCPANCFYATAARIGTSRTFKYAQAHAGRPLHPADQCSGPDEQYARD